MTSTHREEALEALRRERWRTSITKNKANLIAKLKADLEKPTPVILDHATVRGIISDLEKVAAFEKLADRGRA